MAIIPLELCLSPTPVLGGRHQPQYNNVRVHFTLHAIKSFDWIGHAGHFFLDIVALWRCVVSLTPGGCVFSPLEERSHWDPLNKTPLEQVTNFSGLKAQGQRLKRYVLSK